MSWTNGSNETIHTEAAMERPAKARAVKMAKRMMIVDLEVEWGLLKIVGDLSVTMYQSRSMGGLLIPVSRGLSVTEIFWYIALLGVKDVHTD